MVILEMMGGLGNQMFQYAYSLELRKRRIDVVIDTALFHDTQFSYSLDVFPHVACSFYQGDSIYGKGLLHTVKRAVYRRGGKLIEENQLVGEWDSDMLDVEDCYVYGYFQNQMYFRGNEDEIVKAFEFNSNDNILNEYIDIIENDNTVSIHLRRGDYLELVDIYGGICTDSYYTSAIECVLESVNNPKFIVFSNDYSWAQDWLKKLGVNCLKLDYKRFNKYHDWYDMCLMSHCRHNILANSTFSWWGGWLNSHEEKTVICPSSWDQLNKERRMACEDWIEIDSNGNIQ